MIIYGSKGVTKTLNRGSFDCPFCCAPRQYLLRSIRTYFTLYFIPLFPVGSGQRFVECGSCSQTFDVAVLAGGAPATAPAQSTAAQEEAPPSRCSSCGASISYQDDECAYCHTPVANGHPAYATNRSAALHRENLEHAQRATHEETVRKAGLHSIIWSLAGVFVCCFPLSLVGLLKALTARKQARLHDMPVPGTAWASLVLSGFGLVMTAVMGVWFAIDSAALERRKEEVAAVAAAGAGRQLLLPETACAFAELEVLENGYSDLAAISLDSVECLGVLKLQGDQASLGDIRLRGTGKTHYDVRACFARGSKWYLKALVPTSAGCSPAETDQDPPAAE